MCWSSDGVIFGLAWALNTTDLVSAKPLSSTHCPPWNFSLATMGKKALLVSLVTRLFAFCIFKPLWLFPVLRDSIWVFPVWSQIFEPRCVCFVLFEVNSPSVYSMNTWLYGKQSSVAPEYQYTWRKVETLVLCLPTESGFLQPAVCWSVEHGGDRHRVPDEELQPSLPGWQEVLGTFRPGEPCPYHSDLQTLWYEHLSHLYFVL